MDIWKHGKFIDLWSLVHFLSGYLLGDLFYLLGSSFVWSLVFSLMIIVIWELFELAAKIIEPSLNVIFDILIGLAGFFLSALIYFYLDLNFDLSLNIAVLILTLVIALWGLIDFWQRGYR